MSCTRETVRGTQKHALAILTTQNVVHLHSASGITPVYWLKSARLLQRLGACPSPVQAHNNTSWCGNPNLDGESLP